MGSGARLRFFEVEFNFFRDELDLLLPVHHLIVFGVDLDDF
jgi:hypothetical protein